jgi:hypothetical protein
LQRRTHEDAQALIGRADDRLALWYGCVSHAAVPRDEPLTMKFLTGMIPFFGGVSALPGQLGFALFQPRDQHPHHCQADLRPLAQHALKLLAVDAQQANRPQRD